MSAQFSTSVRSAWVASLETSVGTSPKLQLRTGAPPASCASSASGTLIDELTLPSDWLTDNSDGTGSKNGTWSGTSADASGTVGHYRLNSSGGTCHHQGIVTEAFKLTTSATTSADSNVLTFTSTSGVTAGMDAVGTGVPSGATVLSVTATTVKLSAPSTAGVTSGTDIYFGDTSGELWLNNTDISVTQPIEITAWSITMPGA